MVIGFLARTAACTSGMPNGKQWGLVPYTHWQNPRLKENQAQAHQVIREQPSTMIAASKLASIGFAVRLSRFHRSEIPV